MKYRTACEVRHGTAIQDFEGIDMRPFCIGTALAAALLGAGMPAYSAEGDAVVGDFTGGAITGVVTMVETPSGVVLVEIRAEGVPPGIHGLHVHDRGVCDETDGFESAGNHLSGAHPHGVMTDGGPHPGDFPNVHVGEDGLLRASFFTRGFSLDVQGEVRLIDDDGAALILHADADDYVSQPSGNAGDRIACAVLNRK